MKHLAFAVLLCTGCNYYTDGNWNPEEFRAEYQAVGTEVLQEHTLGSIRFKIVSWDELQRRCAPVKPSPDVVCNGLHQQEEGYIGHTHVIYLPRPPEDHCDPPNDDATSVYAITVIHELLHAEHFPHDTKESIRGDIMNRTRRDAWEWYRDRHCQ